MSFRVLVVDDEREMCVSLSEILCSHGFEAGFTTDPLAVSSLIKEQRTELVIMDIRMPQMHGIDLLKAIKGQDRSIPVIMITGYPTIENAVEAMRYGALNFFVKPLRIRELIREIEQLRDSSSRAVEPQGDEAAIVTRNGRMLQVLEEIERVAQTDVPVLITGESGTGKELVANAVHDKSPRRGRPFVKINCASIPDTLLESEMFGHERGAFTDAVRRHVGKLEAADSGTLFLDEIGDMAAGIQPKLLRALQDGEFQRLGGSETLRSDVRLIAATNQDVEELLEDKRFRGDLFYRLSVITIHLPALRERREDIDTLGEHFLSVFNRKYGKQIGGFSEPVREILFRHQWPGNVRELRNCIERAVIFCDGPVIDERHLSRQYLKLRDEGFPDSLEAIVQRMSRERIREALARSRGEKQEAARLLGISRKTLYNWMKKYGLE